MFGLKVVFAEDNEVINELYQMVIDDLTIKNKNLKGFFCFDGETALCVIRDNPGSLIFCDNGLPGISGRSVFQKITDDQIIIKDFYLVTGLIDDEFPPSKTIPKPFDIAEIKNIIEKYT